MVEKKQKQRRELRENYWEGKGMVDTVWGVNYGQEGGTEQGILQTSFPRVNYERERAENNRWKNPSIWCIPLTR